MYFICLPNINDAAKAEKIVERIKEQIIQEVSQVLSELPLDSRKILFDKISIYDLHNRTYIKEYTLKS
jgi:hypothetical protein